MIPLENLVTIKTDQNRQIGKFRIRSEEINNPSESAKLIFGQCVILRAECIPYYDWFEYVGISPLFREVPVGEIIPLYDFWFTKNEGSTTFSVLEVK